jgi:diacylglycerol O-acyltransferase
LWEMYVVEGLDNIDWLPPGCFAILTRLHHAAVDGTAAAELTWGLHDLSPQGDDNKTTSAHHAIRSPSNLEMAGRAWWNNATSPLRLAKPISHILPKLGRRLLDRKAQHLSPGLEKHQGGASVPKTRFNGRVSPHRVYTCTRLPLEEFKSLRALAPGCTINDLVVTIIGGGLRKYLEHHGELPEASLVAAMPVNTRSKGGTESGAENQIAIMAAAIGSHIADPVERLQYVFEQISKSKTALAGIGASDLTDINKHAPAALLAAAGKMISTVGFDTGGTGKRIFNLAISNVPGPPMPLYLRGAQLRFWSIVAPLADGMGTMFAVTSYNGEIFICPTGCRDILPDPEFLEECVAKSYQEILACVPKKPTTKRKRTAARKKARSNTP